MRRFLLPLLLLLGLCAPALSQSGPPSSVGCNKSAIYDASTNGSTKLVTGNANQTIYICGFYLAGGGTATVKLIYGTGTACATGTNSITPGFPLLAQTQVPALSPFYAGLTTVPVSNDLCINTSAGVAIQAIVYYGVTP